MRFYLDEDEKGTASIPDEWQAARLVRLSAEVREQRPVAIVGYNDHAVERFMKLTFGLRPNKDRHSSIVRTYWLFRWGYLSIRWLRDPEDFKSSLNARTVLTLPDPVTLHLGEMDSPLCTWMEWHDRPTVVRPRPRILNVREWVADATQAGAPGVAPAPSPAISATLT